MLEVKQLRCGYDDMEVVHGIDFSVKLGSILALVGANGAGKTSVIGTIAGHVALRAGEIWWEGQRLDGLPQERRAAQGIAWVPEGRRLFADLTVRENLVVGGMCLARSAQSNNLDRVIDLFPRVGQRLNQRSGTLSGGEQQMVAIGRALMAEPRLLLIDELSLGLMPKAVSQCYDALRRLQSQGLAVLLVEQNTQNALAIADQVLVLESGQAVWQGSCAQAKGESGLIDRYLGLASG